MSRVVKSNRGFPQLLAQCPDHQLQFLLKTATPQQVHALVQIIYNVLYKNIPVTEDALQKCPFESCRTLYTLQNKETGPFARGW